MSFISDQRRFALPAHSITLSPSQSYQIVAKGTKDGLSRGWVHEPAHGYFQSDRNTQHSSLSELVALTAPTNQLTFTVVPSGSGHRIGIDRDGRARWGQRALPHVTRW